MYNKACMKKEEFEFYTLTPTYEAPRIQDKEFLLIMNKGEIRKPVLLNYPRHRFDRKLKICRKLIIWN